MVSSIRRCLYRGLLRLHPPSFWREFADEMLWIFDQVAARESTATLFADAAASLLRQWVLRGELRKLLLGDTSLVPASGSTAGLFAWEHIGVPETPLPFSRVMQGILISVAFFVALSFAMSQPLPKRTASRFFAQSKGMGPQTTARNLGPGRRADSNGEPFGAGSNDANSGATQTDPPIDSTEPRFAAGAALAQSESPNTPAARQLRAWLDAFNSGDRGVFLAFLDKNYPDQSKEIDGMMRFRAMTGGFEFKKMEKSDDTHFVAIVKERDSDQFARVDIEVDPAEPHQIKRLDLNAIPTPAEFALARMTEEQAVAALRSEIDHQVAADHFSGAMMVSKNGRTVFSGAFGLSDREKKTKNELNTRFRIGSMNKMFTAVATLQLVQSGKIKLTAPLGEYLPDYPNKDIASKVTIHHLLTHSGGTGDFFGPEFDKHRLELRTLQDYVNLYGKRGLAFEPGSKWAYSNYGFLLLGVVVQRVSGEDYYEYVRKHVYAPAGMTSTDSLPEDQTVPLRSVGYTKMGGDTWHPNTDTLPYRGTSAGGGYSTVEDLQHFADALLNHKLLDADYTDLLTTGKVDTGGGDKYAYGFMDRTSGGVRSFGHGGGAPGMNGDLTIYPQSGYVVTVLANLDPPAAQRLADFIGNRLPEK